MAKYGKYAEYEIFEGLFLAACYAKPDGAPGVTAASRQLGITKQTIHKWWESHPDLVEEARKQADEYNGERRAIVKENCLRIAALASEEILERLSDPNRCKEITPWHLNGMLDYAVKNHELLSGRATGRNESKSDLNVTEKLIIELHNIEKAERLKTLNGTENRIKKYFKKN